MSKKNIIYLSVFLLASLWPGCERGSQADQPVMHVSQRVKIKRPEVPAVVKVPEIPVQPENQVVNVAMQPVEGKPEALKAESPGLPGNQTGISPVPPETLPASAIPAAPGVQTPSVAAAGPGTSAQTAAGASTQPPASPELGDTSDLVGETEALFGDEEKYYVKKGRIDPFKPFLNKPEPKPVESQQGPQRRTPRTPLERIAIGQLKLTAIMHLVSGDQSLALVEDNNGKGYIVKTGTYIGEQGGRVAEINESKLIIEEDYKDVFGKTSVRQIELKLQKQPGE